MIVSEGDRKIVENLFKAMQKGPSGESDMMALFAENAVFIEPFSGQLQTHTGKPAIRDSFRAMWQNPAPDLALTLDRVDVDGAVVRAEWTCTSPVFPAPMHGYDLFTVRSGKIDRLEIVVTDMPPMGDMEARS
ncbi:MAG: nuclear transport factor 2 family protein [Planctomycetota bacterium]